MATLANCRLTEETLERFASATRRMVAALGDPRVRDELRRQDAENEGEADRVRSVAGIASRFERVPALREAIGAAGMSPRDYVVVQLTLYQSSVAAVWLEGEGAGRISELPKGTSAENVEFVRTHRARIGQLTDELRRLTPAADAPAPAEAKGADRAG